MINICANFLFRQCLLLYCIMLHYSRSSVPPNTVAELRDYFGINGQQVLQSCLAALG